MRATGRGSSPAEVRAPDGPRRRGAWGRPPFTGPADRYSGAGWCSAVRHERPKKRRDPEDRAEDSAIGGEWRNMSAVPKEEVAGPRTVTRIPYCGAQCKSRTQILSISTPSTNSAASRPVSQELHENQ